MSTGYRSETQRRSDADLYQMLGSGDTPKLYARPVKLITNKSIGYGGGTSVDGKNVYIDEQLYAEIMCRRSVPERWWIIVRGMSADQIVQAIIEHEHSEWAVDAGDNAVDRYEAAHEYANTKELRFVKLLGVDPNRYSDALEAALTRCYRRDPTNPPKDLWCGPYLDDANKRDKEILRIYRAHGVVDAFKKSKIEVNYGVGQEQCQRCSMFGPESGTLRTCSITSGLVRANRMCDKWQQKGVRHG